jgi:hypothetical protein
MEIDFKYALSDEDARSRLEVLGQYLGNKHGIQVTWVEPMRAKFRGEDPGFLWRNRAKEYIKDKLAKYLDPKVELAQLPRS